MHLALWPLRAVVRVRRRELMQLCGLALVPLRFRTHSSLVQGHHHLHLALLAQPRGAPGGWEPVQLCRLASNRF